MKYLFFYLIQPDLQLGQSPQVYFARQAPIIQVILAAKNFHLQSDFMGQVKLNLLEFADNQTHTDWFPLKKNRHSSKDITGSLQISIHFSVISSEIVVIP